MGKVRHVLLNAAGEYPPHPQFLVEVGRALAVLSVAAAPLAVELYSSGVLSALLRVAQRWVAIQPGERQDSAVTVLKDGLAHVVYAFGHTVPQARACVTC